MIIEKILKKLTPERVKREIKAVQRTKLPLGLKKWVREYEKVGERNEFIWRWLYRMFRKVQLPVVPKRYQKSLRKIKVLMTMFVCLLDDIADKKQKIALLNELLKIPLEQKYIEFDYLDLKERRYLTFAKKVWNYIEKSIKKYPRYGELKEIFNFDICQVLNEMKYSYLVNKNLYLINKIECWLFMPFNMVVFLYSGLDLMCAPGVHTWKIGKIREIIWESQKMARIGNWVSTWEREVYENDFASGIFVYAIDAGIITIDELKQKSRPEIIERIKKAKIDKKLLIEWEQSYYKIKELGREIDETSLIKKFLSRLEKLIVFHLTSRGYK